MKKNLLKAGVKFLAVAVLLICGGGVLGCKNAADGGVGGGGGGGGRDAGGSGGGSSPIVAPSTADMVKDMENAIPSLKGTADETKVKDFLDALSSTPAAKDAFDKWAKDPNGGYDQNKAEAIKALADKYDTEKNTSGTPTIVDTIKDLAKNNDGSDAKNTTSDLSKILDQTTNGGGTPIKDTITNALNTADTERQAVLKALSGTSPNAATSAGEAKSTALNTLGVTSADLYPLVSGLSGDANKNKLASLDNDLIKSLVKDKASKTPTGSNALKDYLNGGGDIADLTTYKDAIKANYPESNGQTLAQFIQNQKDLKNIYNKLGGGNEAAGKAAYGALINGGVTADKIKALVTAADQNADKIKDLPVDVVKAIVAKTSNPVGTTALGDYLKDPSYSLDDIKKYGEVITSVYPSTSNKTLKEYIDSIKASQRDDTSGNRTLKGDTPVDGATVTDKGSVVSPGKPVQTGETVLGYVYDVDPATNTAFVVGKPRDKDKTNSSTTDVAIAWATNGKAAGNGTNDIVPTANIESGKNAWTAIHSWNSSAVFGYYTAIKTALIYPKTRSDSITVNGVNKTLKDATQKSEEQAERDALEALFKGDDYSSGWYLPSVKELQAIYASLPSLPETEQVPLRNKTFWSANVDATDKTKAKSVTFVYDAATGTYTGATVQSDAKSNTHTILPITDFKY